MAITRAKKETLLAGLTDILSKTSSLVFLNFKGLTVHEGNELRASLKKGGVKYQVVKKTLLKRALLEKQYEGTMPELPGEVAMAYLHEGDDQTAPARETNPYVKKLAGKLTFLGGMFENRYLSQPETVTIASIPSIPVLRGMFVNIINSPIQRFAIALNEVAKKKG